MLFTARPPALQHVTPRKLLSEFAEVLFWAKDGRLQRMEFDQPEICVKVYGPIWICLNIAFPIFPRIIIMFHKHIAMTRYPL